MVTKLLFCSLILKLHQEVMRRELGPVGEGTVGCTGVNMQGFPGIKWVNEYVSSTIHIKIKRSQSYVNDRMH